MINTAYYRGKKVAVVGLARSGLACANLLYDLGSRVWVTDNKDDDLIRLNALKLKSKEINLELGSHSQEFIREKDLVVVSPGVPPMPHRLSGPKNLEYQPSVRLSLPGIYVRGRLSP